MSAMKPEALRREVNRLRVLVQAHAKSLSESEANRLAIEIERDQFCAQVRTLTAERDRSMSMNNSMGRRMGEFRKQRTAALQAIANVLADLAATPEDNYPKS